MAYPEYDNLLIDRVGKDDQIARITLNRPEKMNSLSQELLFEFRDALENLEPDDTARVIIVRGAGRTFSAGYDLTPAKGTGADAVAREFKTVDDQGRRLWQGVRAGMQRITNIHMYFWNLQKVTIAQVHGYAIAGGCELSMMADLVVCADDARFGHPGLRFAGTRTSMILPLLIPMRKAKELFYTGDNISGTEAAELGMANKAVPFDQLEEQTLALAERVANLPADHLAQLKIHMNRFHENMGIYSSVHSSTDLDAAGTFTTQSYGWSDKFKEGGLKEALAWRDGPYQDYSATPKN
jgi:enoyl-CoA hydratase|tara:strand:- start:129 stop:1016 length:888 start_codon:yes stop_codon:yes gene_type:complete